MNKKEEILKAAFSLLEEEGDISTLNMRKTAKYAGCAHTNVYNYFSSFEALKWAMLKQSLQSLDEYIFQKKRNDSDDVFTLISLYIDFAIEHPAVYKLIWVTDLDPASAPEDTDFLYLIPHKLAALLPPDKADILHSYVHGKLLNMIFSRLPAGNINEQKAGMLDVCKNILG